MTTDYKEINRRGFGLKEAIKPLLNESYHSPLIEAMKDSDYQLIAGDLTICLAREFGFCYGVDRAVDLAYETRRQFPGRTIYLTSEIIHNPRVNQKLEELGVKFIEGSKSCSIDAISQKDVVLIPAFGTSTDLLERLKSKGCILVDTTCGSVIAVWRRVEQYARDGFTSVIHGKFKHEETLATSSRATQFPGGKFLVVRDQAQTQVVCDFIKGKVSKDAFLNEFGDTMSKGFDPTLDLTHIGCANQTTMLSSESLAIAEMIKKAMSDQYGASDVKNRFRYFDTICSATQDRQDAVLELVNRGVDVMIVVGGYNSSNTGHLQEISSRTMPAFHVRDADEILSKTKIRHKPMERLDTTITQGWLPQGKSRIGVTAGASTPNRVIEEVIQKVIECSGEVVPSVGKNQ